ncbi:MAG: proteasome assembly chaperone family protein [Thermoplasmatota archaeon]
MDLMHFVEREVPETGPVIFVEGLPGVGNVGKLAAQHLVDALDAKLWADIFSHDFPPQVTVETDGTVRLVRCQLWYVPAEKGPALAILTGDYQPLSSPGQYALVEGVLERLAALGCERMYTLGGYGLGTTIEDPEVLGAATDLDTVGALKDLGVKFEEDEPGGGIIGASGLFLGLGMQQNISGACLMGETSGYMVDPAAARAVLAVLEKLLGRPIDTADLDEKAEELDRITHQLHEAETAAKEPGDLHYIG